MKESGKECRERAPPTKCYVCFATRRKADARPCGSTEKKKQPRSRSDSSELSTSTHQTSTAAVAAAAMDSTSLVSLSAASFQHHRAPGTRDAQSGRGGTVACTAVCTVFFCLIARGTFVAFFISMRGLELEKKRSSSREIKGSGRETFNNSRLNQACDPEPEERSRFYPWFGRTRRQARSAYGLVIRHAN